MLHTQDFLQILYINLFKITENTKQANHNLVQRCILRIFLRYEDGDLVHRDVETKECPGDVEM